MQDAIEVDVVADGFFSLSMYDSIDGDEVNMGTTHASRNFTLDIDILITFEGHLAGDDITASKVEILRADSLLSFGYLEPEYKDDWDDEQGRCLQ
ncbi:MAG: hypothetical protein WDN02_05130 [Methylovirgula sp.]|uniref:hypothetical protein n=1 Tax=Methylovirgula sp. TaxID=1978224 RepID=UPI0030762D20